MSEFAERSLEPGVIETEAGVVADIARAAAGPQPFVLDPEVRAYMTRTRLAGGGDAIQILDTEYLQEAPRRTKGDAAFTETESFVRYLDEFPGGDHDHRRIYASIEAGQIVAVLNDDISEAPAWRDHRAHLALLRTPEWNAWRQKDGHMGTQVAFAEHLEVRLRDISDPPAADLVEVSRSFTASSEISFRSAHDLATGQTQFAYDEDVTTTAGTKQIAVPKVFTLTIALFRGTDPVLVTARLRYRLRGSDLTIGYILDLPDDAEESVLRDVLVSIETDTGIKPLMGTPPTPR